MTHYTGTSAYDFSLFEPQQREEERRQREVKKETERIKKESRATEKSAVPAYVVKAVAAAVVCLAMVVVLLGMRSTCDKLNSEIEAAKSELKIAQSENTRLTAELNSMISADKIEDYAENVLGMVKVEAYQITYLDLSEGDEVVVSGDKEVKSGDSFWSEVKELFAYIF